VPFHRRQDIPRLAARRQAMDKIGPPAFRTRPRDLWGDVVAGVTERPFWSDIQIGDAPQKQET